MTKTHLNQFEDVYEHRPFTLLSHNDHTKHGMVNELFHVRLQFVVQLQHVRVFVGTVVELPSQFFVSLPNC